MPTTRDDLSHDQSVSLPVRVLSRRPAAGSKRACWFDVEDEAGNEIPLLVWEKHRSVAEDLIVGERARLTDFRVKEWPGHDLELHTVSDARVTAVDRSATRILHISDTHIGYHLRPESGGKIMPWHDEVDRRSRFPKVIAAAYEHEVDAVVHTGDIFDHGVTDGDLEMFESGLQLLNSEDIRFFYVVGNHEPSEGKALLRELAATGLAFPLEQFSSGYLVGNVRLYGLDNRSPKWWRNPNVNFTPASGRHSLVCLHQTVSPPYSKPNPDCTVDTIRDTVASRLQPDLLLLGDLHGPYNAPTASIPAYYAGPTARISSQYETTEPQVNLFEFDGSPSHHSVSL